MVTAASEMELFLPQSYDIFWSLVILIIVAVFFYKFFLPKFQAVFDERAAKIEGGIAKAEQAQKDADEAKAKYDAQLSNARVEASKIRDDARAEASHIIADARTRAEADAAQITATAQRSIESQQQQALTRRHRVPHHDRRHRRRVGARGPRSRSVGRRRQQLCEERVAPGCGGQSPALSRQQLRGRLL